MASTRSTLESVDSHLEESMGVRDAVRPVLLSPTPDPKDVGRRPLGNVASIAVDQIVPDPSQPRKAFSEDALQRLADSIRDQGQPTPIAVRWSPGLAKWIITAGERRWRACKRLGLPTIACCFREDEITRTQTLQTQLVENLLREDLGPIEEAKAFAELIELNGWNGKQLAEAIHVPASKVTRALALLKLPSDVQAQIANGKVSARSGYEISRLKDVRAQRKLAALAAAGQLNHIDANRAARRRSAKPRPASRPLSLTFASTVGWKVTVAGRVKGTYDEIEQALVEALEEVRHRITNDVTLY